jgi:hypothetical protein
MEGCISPVNWLSFNSLEIKSENKSVIIGYLMIVLQLTNNVKGQDCQWKRVIPLSSDFYSNFFKNQKINY